MKKNCLFRSAGGGVIWLASVFLLQSCTRLEMLSDVSQSANASPQKGAIELHYEAENVTYQELDKANASTAFDKIHAMANAHRSKIDLQIYEDGTSAWKMTKLTPKHDVKINDLTPVNPMPQTRTTQVDRSGMGFFYGDDGKLLHKHAVPTKSFGDLVAQVKKNPEAIYSALGVKPKQRIDEIIANAKANGAIVTDLGNNNISVRQSVVEAQMPSSNRARVPSSNYKSVDIINTNLNVVVGSALYDENEKLVSQVYYRYKINEERKLVPEAMYMKTWTTLEKTGKTVITISNTYFDNVSETINID
ncbi:hypothetical protein [Spirosoma foliorum]|uniref:Lipoprotein n=1 Tax=Spirosoma foliorum TaxID=2710596 RepID=A0A7G5GRI4_9BACT|nr:hypothetical protein [Spirosoma foliorum]QMW01476.1 hypothetical protein H3H32_26465 [Spirosoma foliorum]